MFTDWSFVRSPYRRLTLQGSAAGALLTRNVVDAPNFFGGLSHPVIVAVLPVALSRSGPAGFTLFVVVLHHPFPIYLERYPPPEVDFKFQPLDAFLLVGCPRPARVRHPAFAREATTNLSGPRRVKP